MSIILEPIYQSYIFIGIICILSLKRVRRIDFCAVYDRGDKGDRTSDSKTRAMQQDIASLTLDDL